MRTGKTVKHTTAQEHTNHRAIHRRNGLLISALLLLAGILFLVSYVYKADGNEVIVELDGVITQRFRLSEDREEMIYTGVMQNELSTPAQMEAKDAVHMEGVNELIIKDGEAYVRSANCPNQVCVHAAPISKVGQSITCLPHRVHIYIAGKEAADYDAYTN